MVYPLSTDFFIFFCVLILGGSVSGCLNSGKLLFELQKLELGVKSAQAMAKGVFKGMLGGEFWRTAVTVTAFALHHGPLFANRVPRPEFS